MLSQDGSCTPVLRHPSRRPFPLIPSQLHEQLLRLFSLVAANLPDEALVVYLKRAARETRKARRK